MKRIFGRGDAAKAECTVANDAMRRWLVLDIAGQKCECRVLTASIAVSVSTASGDITDGPKDKQDDKRDEDEHSHSRSVVLAANAGNADCSIETARPPNS